MAVSESSYQELLKQHQENVEQLQLIDKREEAGSSNKTSLQKQGGFKMIVNVMYIFKSMYKFNIYIYTVYMYVFKFNTYTYVYKFKGIYIYIHI